VNGRDLRMTLLFSKRHPPWFTSSSNNALATAPSPSGMVVRFLKPSSRGLHEQPGLLTVRSHIKRPLDLASVDKPMAQLHGGRISLSVSADQHIAGTGEHKRGPQETDRRYDEVVTIGQARVGDVDRAGIARDRSR
jgi:hypothetical protein